MNRSESIPKPVRIFLLIALILDLIGLACEAIARFWLHLGPPYNSPVLATPWAIDLTTYAGFFKFLHTPRFFDTVYGTRYEYPAPVAPLYGFFLSFPTAVFECTLAGLLVAAALAFGRLLHRRGLSPARSAAIAGGVLVLSYPALMELKQGNMELFVCILVGLGVWAFARGRFHAAAAFIGIAGAMKLFPLVYFGLFLAQRRYRALVTGVISALVVTLASLLYIDPSLSIAWHGVQSGLAAYRRTLAPAVVFQSSYDHSLFYPIKQLLLHAERSHAVVTSQRTLTIYLAVAAVSGIILFFTRIRLLPFINQVLCLCVASILLMPVSYDYTLLHLYIPWAMLVCFALARRAVPTAGLTPVFVWLAVATSIETEIVVHGHSCGGLIKTCALCILMVLALRHPFEEKQEVPSRSG